METPAMETSDGLSKHTQLPDGTTLHVCNYQPSITSVLRSVKRLEHSNFNNIASLIHDASFVTHFSALLPSLPLFANARCGLWYTPQYHAISYFKSTDGHDNNWSFNLKRLNLHVAYHAAHSHGAIIVDATRRGKRFPDSMSKTIPIWAAVINMAIREIHNNSNISSNNNTRNADIINKASPPDLSSSLLLHLPPWVSVNEKNQIAQRLHQWVTNLVEMSREDLMPLVDVLDKKPLRCFWISQPYDDDDDGREEGTTTTIASSTTTTLLSALKDERMKEDMFQDCTPLLLVSAALPNARIRRTLTLKRNNNEEEEEEEEDSSVETSTTPLALFPLSSSSVLKVVYEYIPGAGDDEESWAHGLTPSLMWKHHFELLSTGARDGEEALNAMMVDIVARHGKEADTSGNNTTGTTITTIDDNNNSYQKIGNTGLYLGTSMSSCRFDAILNVGSVMSSSSVAVAVAAAAAAAAVEGNNGDVSHNELSPCIHLFQPNNDEYRRRMSAVQPYHYTVPSQEKETKATSPPPPSTTTNGEDDTSNHYSYLWLPIKSGKKDRHDLQAKLPAALQFLSYHLEAGRTVLIHDAIDDKTVGSDIAASIAVATLIACFDITVVSNDSKAVVSSLSLQPISVDRQFKFKPVNIHPTTGCPLPSVNATAFDKLAVKKALAILAMYCTEVRPSQTSLKQVYNCFLP